MNFEPQKFFIGVVEFFSILLPGALLTYLLKDQAGPLLLGKKGYEGLTDTERGVVFFFCAYLFGHFIFLLGSLLDNRLYEPIRNATEGGRIERLARGKELPGKLTRRLARWLISDKADQALHRAVAIKERYLDPQEASSAIQAFQWCKARLTLENPGAMATIQRFEADSKFFRSLMVVLPVLILWGIAVCRPVVALAGLPILILSFWRYMDQRGKSITQAYWYIITLEGNKGEASRHPMPSQKGGPSHAGGVVYRQKGGQTTYLLVQAKKNPEEWVFPKGHIEPGEGMREAAVREVREETGVWARIKGELNSVSFTVSGEPVKVQYYLMEALEEAEPSDNRKHDWLSLDKAVRQAKHPQNRELLKLAEKIRTAR